MSETPQTEAPEQVLELIEVCARLVEKTTGLRPAFEPESLPLLDHTLRQLGKGAVAERMIAATAAGAWLGELVRHHFPARWYAPRDDHGEWRIEFEPVFLHFSPVAFAHEAAVGQDVVEGGAGFGVLEGEVAVLNEGLEALGSISEEDFYLLSTRYEVLSTVFERLLVAQASRPERTLSYDADSYRAVLDEGGAVGDA